MFDVCPRNLPALPLARDAGGIPKLSHASLDHTRASEEGSRRILALPVDPIRTFRRGLRTDPTVSACLCVANHLMKIFSCSSYLNLFSKY